MQPNDREHLPRPATGPIAVGGLGGSGTRLVAEILRGAGVYMGSDLNRSADNLWFTLLFKRPRWLERELGGEGSGIDRGLQIFERAMQGLPPRSFSDLTFVTRATTEMAIWGHNREGAGRGTWAFRRGRSLLSARRVPAPAWGWKEPNAFLVIPHLARYFESRVRYVHVIRNGLDMASTDNQQQLALWGPRFDVRASERGGASAALKYWVSANEWAVETADLHFGERFLRVEYEALCLEPRVQIQRLLEFARVSTAPLDALTDLPRSPQTRTHADLGAFDPDDLDRLARLGYPQQRDRSTLPRARKDRG